MPSIASWAPQRFRDRTLDGFVPSTPSAKAAVVAAHRFVAGDIRTLVLAGPTGCGKTHLAVAAAQDRHSADLGRWWQSTTTTPDGPPSMWERVRSPAIPEWCSVPELIVGLRADMDRDRSERRWADTLDDFAAFSGIVVLDDLGREKASDWTGEAVYVLVNGRYERELPTIVTTNLTGAELAASPYWPVISRLAEDGELVRLEAADYRLHRRAIEAQYTEGKP